MMMMVATVVEETLHALKASFPLRQSQIAKRL